MSANHTKEKKLVISGTIASVNRVRHWIIFSYKAIIVFFFNNSVHMFEPGAIKAARAQHAIILVFLVVKIHSLCWSEADEYQQQY